MSESNSLPSLEELRMMRVPDVVDAIRLSKSRIRQLEQAGQFPRRVALGDNSIGYREVEIRRWLAERVANGKVKHKGATNLLAAPPPKRPAQPPTKPKARAAARRGA